MWEDGVRGDTIPGSHPSIQCLCFCHSTPSDNERRERQGGLILMWCHWSLKTSPVGGVSVQFGLSTRKSWWGWRQVDLKTKERKFIDFSFFSTPWYRVLHQTARNGDENKFQNNLKINALPWVKAQFHPSDLLITTIYNNISNYMYKCTTRCLSRFKPNTCLSCECIFSALIMPNVACLDTKKKGSPWHAWVQNKNFYLALFLCTCTQAL